VRFLDDTTFEQVHAHALDPLEMGQAILTCSFTDSSGGASGGDPGSAAGAAGASSKAGSTSAPASAPAPSPSTSQAKQEDKVYVVVGTAYVHEDEFEPQAGRLLVFAVEGEGSGAKVTLVSERETRGAVYCLESFNGKLLAGINSKVQLYRWESKGEGVYELNTECGHHGHILALHMRSRGDFIVVGDLMRSISLLLYKPIDSSIEEISRDFNANWMTAVEMVDDDYFLGAENDSNLFVVRRNAEAATDEDRTRLDPQGEFHLGEFVNRFHKGSLVMQPVGDASGDGEKDLPPSVVGEPVLFGAVSGMIGAIFTLTPEAYMFFHHLQWALTRVIQGVGGLQHNLWRSYTSHRRQARARNFIDGDLVESFLDLPREKMDEVLQFMKEGPPASQSDDVITRTGASNSSEELTVDRVCRRVEEMTRMH